MARSGTNPLRRFLARTARTSATAPDGERPPVERDPELDAARAVHDPVAAATVEEADARAGEPDDGRGRRPASVGLLWTDVLGRSAVRALQVLLIVAVAALFVWAGLQVTIVVIPVLLALIIASAAFPLVERLRRWGWPSALATIVVLLAVVVVLGLAIWLVVEMVIGQWDTLRDSTMSGVDAVLGWVQATFGIVIDQAQLNTWFEQVRSFVFTSQFASGAASGLTAGLSAVATFLTSAVLLIVVLFFFMKDGPVIWNFLLRPVEGARRRRFKLMGRRAVGVMGGYVRGTVIVALVDAVFIGIGLWIVGVPLAFPLAVIVFICAFIPVVGATLAGIIAALVTLVTNGFWPAVIVIAIVVMVNQLEGNLLQPVVLGRSLKLHELVVLLALTVGTVLGGIIGTLLSVPIAAVVWALVSAWYEPLPELEEEANRGAFGRDPEAERAGRERSGRGGAHPETGEGGEAGVGLGRSGAAPDDGRAVEDARTDAEAGVRPGS